MEIEEFLSYWRVIRKRLWLIALLLVATLAVILVTTLSAPPVYRATVKMQVVGSEPQQVNLFSTVRAASLGDEIAAVQGEFTSVLKNGLVAWRTIAGLNLDIDAAKLLSGINVSRDGDAMYVVAAANTPQEAEAIINQHVDNALQYYRDYRALPAQVSRQFLTQQVAGQGDIQAAAQDALLKFKLENNVEALDRELIAYQDLIRALEAERDEARVAELRSRTMVTSYGKQAQQASTEFRRWENTEATSMQAYYRDLGQRYEQYAAGEEVKADASRAAGDEYDRLIAQKKDELLALISLSEDYTRLQRQVQLAESNYNFLLSKENEAKLKEANALAVGWIQVVEPARRPDAPAQSNLPRLLVLGAIASLLAGIILAFLIEFFEGLGRVVSTREPTAR